MSGNMTYRWLVSDLYLQLEWGYLSVCAAAKLSPVPNLTGAVPSWF